MGRACHLGRRPRRCGPWAAVAGACLAWATGSPTAARAGVTVLQGQDPQGTLGQSVAPGGDLDGDGYDEVLSVGSDRVVVVPGSIAGPDAAAATALLPAHRSHGPTIGGGGDLDGDGFDDLV